MTDTKNCCITGHRDLTGKDEAIIKQMLIKEILLAIQEGYTTFISGFADGIDQMFAQIVIDLKQEHKLFLEAALPYANRLTNSKVKRLLTQCDGIKVVCNEYNPDCFMLRNRYMVEQSSRVIAVYDGRDKGGTLFTMRYAHVMDRDVKVINI
ncbi:MAG: DUF1273 domain-containing protein [Eubacterium sp.]|nr:DUF1273 domain-containing protein [Eubacterium sp.]